MKICIINGSPKAGQSTSGLLIGYLMPFIKGNETVIYNVCTKDFSKSQFSQIWDSEVLIFVFPLYIDSINSQLLRFLIELQKDSVTLLGEYLEKNRKETPLCSII